MNEFDFGELLFQSLNKNKKYLINMGASVEDAEDVIQDTAYKFLTYIDSVDISNIDGWLFRVSVNSYYDLYRKRKRQSNILMKFNVKELFEEVTPEKAALQMELKRDIHKILEIIKPKHAEFLILKYSTGLKIEDIAHLYEMKVNSVKTILHRARKQFIEEYGRIHNDKGE
ncbi:RNA polymerase sigma factor [Lysinibacillus mangiferihumi]|uniref:RNA polymerase sigma factor n=1 Tax=Lysinibacillus mangiferihumi TaxID=1130819 RepID=A0A4U2ZB25_9BACI|nr:RNA polymerase sigma factor [Lysinibacillus mangiferihumi]TKI71549.1 RNA polymerase sigma factor [Lysinibacillus mangiferihumi]